MLLVVWRTGAQGRADLSCDCYQRQIPVCGGEKNIDDDADDNEDNDDVDEKDGDGNEQKERNEEKIEENNEENWKDE